MANRSYLFSIDFDRTIEQRNETKKVYGLSEWPYAIPLAYKILVSQEAKLSPSIIFDYDKPIAIIGDFYKGREKLFAFLDELLKLNILDNDELTTQINDAKEYLYDEKIEAKYIILECGEIYEMGTDAFEEANKNLYENEIQQIGKTIDDFISKVKNISGDSKNIMNEIDSMLGIGFWDDVLYYQ